ncbi:hypothetical protein K435DRAFT_857498 [Dendrothele bispora CBS 962.96]|uniref:F-box domain-containing protein n=1 Tax=Dendrothele bispora (strain CBS 962.96) TaxID=1314807 RepID=A0A4S8M5M9_DENBC|nr:hypothetical protein K435DRAFT_857498 [Dendrothele bispora CBS 962.96]
MTSNTQKSMIVAIVLYAQTDRRGRPVSPHWAIAAHENALWQDDTQIYQITQTTTPDRRPGWKLDYKKCSPYNSASIIGILQVGVVNISRFDLDCYANFQTGNADGNNPSGLEMWSCEAWVIRFVWGLYKQHLVYMPCHVTELYKHVMKKRLPVLVQAKKENQGVPQTSTTHQQTPASNRRLMTAVAENTMNIAEPPVSATRRAFEANEIKEGISRNCDRKSLRNLAVVDQQWSEAALDVLWYEVTNLEDLLRPLGSVTSKSREIQVTDPVVQLLMVAETVDNVGIISVTNSPSLAQIPAPLCSSRPTLAEPACHPLRYAMLGWPLGANSNYCPDKSITCEAIPTRMPKLTKLVLEIIPDEKYIPSLISIMEGLTSLQSRTISPFNNMSGIVSCLSGLQNLKELHILSRSKELLFLAPIEIASGFFCREIPSLRAIRVVTFIREQPSNVRSLLRTISGSLPRVTQISLAIKHNTIDLRALQTPLSPESVLTLDVLSSILQRSSIRSFSIQHPLPFDVGIVEVEKIASSWPRLKSLSLACDPYLVQQPTTKLGVDAFLPFVRHCPDIEELGLFIDARSSAIPSSEVLDALPLPFTKLRILSVGTSVIQHEEAIAQFLSLVCTQGCVIKQGVSWFEQSGEYFGESAKKWMDVNRLLRNLLAVRTWYERKLVLEMRRLRATLSDQTK